jgi:putative ABC transport system permease protein
MSINGAPGESITDEQFNEIKGLTGVESVYKNMRTQVSVLVPEDIINPRFAQIMAPVLKDKVKDSIVLGNNELVCYGEAGFAELKGSLRSGTADPEAIDRDNGVVLLVTNRLFDDKTRRVVVLDAAEFKVGDTIYLSTGGNTVFSGDTSGRSVKVTGIVSKDSLGGDHAESGSIRMITTEEVYSSITGNANCKQIGVRIKKGADRGPVAGYFKELSRKDPRYKYIDMYEALQEFKNSMTAVSIFLYGFVGVVTLIGCLNIINTISTNLILRTREISMLKAVGMTDNSLKKLVCLEGIFYGMIAAVYGGITGALMSYIATIILTDVREIEWIMPWKLIFTGAVGAMLITLVSGLIPLKRINSGSIVEKMRIVE